MLFYSSEWSSLLLHQPLREGKLHDVSIHNSQGLHDALTRPSRHVWTAEGCVGNARNPKLQPSAEQLRRNRRPAGRSKDFERSLGGFVFRRESLQLSWNLRGRWARSVLWRTVTSLQWFERRQSRVEALPLLQETSDWRQPRQGETKAGTDRLPESLLLRIN